MRIRPLPLSSFGWIGVLACVAGCHNPAAPQVTPPAEVGPPAITCPADITSAVAVTPAAVSYSLPVVAGGTNPVTEACTMPSGAAFPVGKTDVICTATDATQRQAQCVFHVSVTVTPRVKFTKFMAFGDSLTWGEVAPPAPTSIHIFDPLNNYPIVLQALLKDRYGLQALDISLANRGQQGEGAVDGEDRLAAEVQAGQPEVLLLMEGTNDVNKGTPYSTIAASLRSDVSRAYRYGTKVVFLSTLPPEVPGRFRASNPDGVVVLNDLIRDAAAREGAILVDAYSALAPQQQLLMGDDGLHPTVQGYRVLADTFLAAIAANVETAAAPASLFQGPLSATRPIPGSTTVAPQLVRRRAVGQN